MPSATTFISLEFGTAEQEAMPLGDLAASLVTVDDLLRDLASIAAYPSSAEFRNIEVVAIEMRRPLKIKLSLFAIPEEAVEAFQALCRGVIASRERVDDIGAEQLAKITAAVQRLGITEIGPKEAQRICGHVTSLQNAAVRLRRIEVIAE